MASYFGFAASVTIQAGDEIFEIPNPGLLDDDQQERWEELQFEVEGCDRDDDGDTIKPYRGTPAPAVLRRRVSAASSRSRP